MKVKSESEVAQSCPTLYDPVDCSLPGSSIHGIFQARYWSGLPLLSLLSTWGQCNFLLPLIPLPFGLFEGKPAQNFIFYLFYFGCIGSLIWWMDFPSCGMHVLEHKGSGVVVGGLSCPMACGILAS